MEKLAYRQYELVNVLPFSESQIRKFIKSGELECIRYGRAVLVTIDAIRKFLTKQPFVADIKTE